MPRFTIKDKNFDNNAFRELCFHAEDSKYQSENVFFIWDVENILKGNHKLQAKSAILR
ncbi:hypothetical protein [Piscirickettsia salmonis]|uniref:Uncharacterized protein n=1 Tax=Piscirickettsia salmonis TaxID=1238 RepID=A0A9Q6LKR9_PISSA|nr:hypothetical protein [Piscirickettsia salmonis]ALA25613.1 adenine methyltransferase [Piscirickettsia salmonis]ERL60589.1 hypothetical protein K661_03090 [Piscirickettsia salmonis LF-89 = ATCC VR-1361]QGN78051.1 hypothetical protein Psal001_02271 [Piscirickettsia salmonis]QGN81633.1 hypothetical protein Psal002_02288 [Piscirickettsia salmonis]QGN84095.1 hypothetical protein Psal003_01144 [Piscirickettsia salmonis]